MPKSRDKTKGAQKRRKDCNKILDTNTNDADSDGSDRKICAKRKKPSKKILDLGDEITKSKQLARKLKTKPKLAYTRNQNSKPKLCGNGKPMPPLSELEKMYEDSDDDDIPAPVSVSAPEEEKNGDLERCYTPNTSKANTSAIYTLDKLLSPKTIERYASKVMDVIVNGTMIIEDENGPPPPVVPQKKPKKTGIPYIVGCKERPQVPWQPKTSFCKGDGKYGVEQNANSDAEDECLIKQNKRVKKVNLSKSIFNARSDEIAARLTEFENNSFHQSNSGSPDSNKTEDYECSNKSPVENIPKVFSPIPSTSQDEATFVENDRLFNVSLTSANISKLDDESITNDNLQNDIEIIEIPCETVFPDETSTKQNSTSINLMNDFDDDCCVIVDQDSARNNNYKKRNESPKDDIYGTLDLTAEYENDTCEIIDVDVDDLIAENRALLEKHRKENDFDVVTLVDPTIAIPKPLVIRDNITEVVCENLLQPENQTRATQSLVKNLDKQPVAKNLSTLSSRISSIVDDYFSQPEAVRSPDIQNPSTRHSNNSNTRETPLGNVAEPINVDLTGLTETIMDRFGSWIQNQFSNFNPFPNISQTSNLEKPINNSSGNRGRVEPTKNKTNVQSEDRTSVLNSRGLGDCPICMESLINNSVASTMCGHVYCLKCIQAAIRANGKKCPTCRKSLKGQGYHPLFL